LNPKRPHSLRSFFEPESIAVAGVSTDPTKLGSIIFQNLLENRAKGLLRASVYALNPAHEVVGSQRAYPSIASLPEVPELLVVAVPEAHTEALVESAADAGVKAAIIVTSGYSETGKKDVEEKLATAAARSGMRVVGPNSIGVIDTRSGVDSLFLRPTKTLPDGREVASLLRPLEGGIVIITQSGHLGQAIVEELTANGVGMRALVGTGNQVDVSIEDLVEYFAEDPDTKAIAVYVEGVRDGRKFMEVARRASKTRPLVALKAGKTRSGARAALTHTASLVGDYDVFRAALRQSGVVEARSFQELVDFTISLSMFPPAAGNRLAIVTNAGGVGALAADEAQEAGLKVEPLGENAARRMRSEFRQSSFIANASLGNPIDLTASVTTDDFVKIVREVASLEQYDLVLALPTHQTPAIDPRIADMLVDVSQKAGKPVCMGVVGRAELASEIHMSFMKSGIPSFPTPERAVRALAAAWFYSEARRGGGTTQERPVRSKRITWKKGPLPYQDVSALLRSYGVQEPMAVTLRSSRDLGRLEKLRYPVACKLLSRDLPHKTDVGGVVLGVSGADEAKSCLARLKGIAASNHAHFDGVLVQEMVGKGVELILGGRRDPTFGPVVALGPGGTYVELAKEVSIAVAPVAPIQVRSMLEGTNLQKVMQGYRGGPRVSMDRLCKMVSDFSRIMLENPSIEEVEVNPLIATRGAILAVDARASAH
jgi:acyl-CoA synthetase (NDP forming)